MLRGVVRAVLSVGLAVGGLSGPLMMGAASAAPGTVRGGAGAVPAVTSTTLGSFADVPAGAQFSTEIQWLADQGVSTGWAMPDGTRQYRPLLPVARDAMAAFMYRLAGSPAFTAPAVSPFADITPSTQFYKEITWLAAQGISTGWAQPDGTKVYRPLDSVARDAMAAFMYRLAGSPAFTAPASSPFADITPATQFYKEITWLAANGISTGWTQPDGTKAYQTLSPVNRDAMAAFMYRFGQRASRSCPLSSHLSGTLVTGATLSPSCGPVFLLDADYTVDPGAVLTVQAGTMLEASPGAHLNINGSLVVTGTTSSPVLFTSAGDTAAPTPTPQPGGQVAPSVTTAAGSPWGGIVVQTGGSATTSGLTVRDTTTGLTATASPTASATTRLTLDSTTFDQASTCLSLQGPVVGHLRGAVSNCPMGVSADYPFDATGVDWGAGSGPGTGADARPQVNGPQVAVYPWTGSTPVPAPQPPAPPAPASACGDYYFIGVMGSGEGTVTTPDAYFGPRIEDVYNSFVQTIHVNNPNATIRAQGVNYPANPVPFSGLSSAGQIPSDLFVQVPGYVPGAWQGALDILDTIAQEQAKCGGTAEKVVLAGYSQGAWAVHVALNYADAMWKTGAANKVDMSRISAVGLLADPQRMQTGKEHHLGTATSPAGQGIANASRVAGALFGFADWMATDPTGLFKLPPPDPNTPMASMLYGQEIPQSVIGRTASFCNAMDPVCSFGDSAGMDISVHSYSSIPDRASLGNWLGIESLGATPCTAAGVTATASSSLSTEFALKSDGTVCSWGMGAGGQLGDGLSGGHSSTPVQVTGLDSVAGIAASGGAGYALMNDGTVQSWGDDVYSAVGRGINGTGGRAETVPGTIPGLTGVKQVVPTNALTYALKTDGTVWVWGASFGALNGLSSPVPVQVNGIAGVKGLYANDAQAFAVKDDGTVWAWGDNTYGSLGIGSTTNSLTPQQVVGLSGVASVAPNGNSTYALKTDGTVWGWGWNNAGQLGNGTTTNSSVPVQVSGLNSVKIIEPVAGGGFVAASTDGTLWGWGGANGTSSTGVIPLDDAHASGVSQIETGLAGTVLVLLGDGTVWAWGSNGGGQFGNGTVINSGTTTTSFIPERASVPASVKSISANSDGTVLTLTTDGRVYAWGGNDNGQLGNNSETASTLPVLVGG